MAKLNKKWVVLCSTAIAVVYAAGYAATETQASIDQTATYVRTDQPYTNVSSRKYKDGTYTGMGRNRRGSIQVAVTVKNDNITDVEISDFAMHYSERDVAGLPKEVLQKQSAQVKNVSGATYSTQAFRDAVQDALAQAMNA
ncbi:FMN-binding protein [Paenibacillus doosanensis]|uniref:FMN-binding protein n=1 Tax=Paenibacillus doosanensis TaxID=1229154 RepID=UPI0021802E83|nr:FMN-binding protein [Paenibacillus doosanensis]MCS7461504.1 FMN-binding protein [Paenibacillus doosanensis]